jgi:hypothetical protein
MITRRSLLLSSVLLPFAITASGARPILKPAALIISEWHRAEDRAIRAAAGRLTPLYVIGMGVLVISNKRSVLDAFLVGRESIPVVSLEQVRNWGIVGMGRARTAVDCRGCHLSPLLLRSSPGRARSPRTVFSGQGVGQAWGRNSLSAATPGARSAADVARSLCLGLNRQEWLRPSALLALEVNVAEEGFPAHASTLKQEREREVSDSPAATGQTQERAPAHCLIDGSRAPPRIEFHRGMSC